MRDLCSDPACQQHQACVTVGHCPAEERGYHAPVAAACPGCGSPVAPTYAADFGLWRVRCACGRHGPAQRDEAAAVREWNTKARRAAHGRRHA